MFSSSYALACRSTWLASAAIKLPTHYFAHVKIASPWIFTYHANDNYYH